MPVCEDGNYIRSSNKRLWIALFTLTAYDSVGVWQGTAVNVLILEDNAVRIVAFQQALETAIPNACVMNCDERLGLSEADTL